MLACVRTVSASQRRGCFVSGHKLLSAKTACAHFAAQDMLIGLESQPACWLCIVSRSALRRQRHCLQLRTGCLRSLQALRTWLSSWNCAIQIQIQALQAGLYVEEYMPL